MLNGAGYKTTVVDFSSAQLEMLRTFGVKAYFGDATRPDLLESAGIREAAQFIIAIDDKHQTTELVRYVRTNYPNVSVVARAHDRNHVYDLYAAGCRDIIRETFDSSVRMGRSALEALGMSRDKAQTIADGYTSDDRTGMIVLASLYKPEIPVTENPEYVAKVKEVQAIQKALLKEGPEGFGKLAEKLTEMGEDPQEIVRRFQKDAAANNVSLAPDQS